MTFSPALVRRHAFHRSKVLPCRALLLDVLRRSVEKFWQPFMVGRSGADLRLYRFRDNLRSIRTEDEDFTCQVNGVVGGASILEDFFFVVLCGFDITDVSFAWKSSLYDPCLPKYSGSYTLVHCRPFLGWKPPPPLTGPASSQVGLLSKSPHSLSKLENSTVVSNSYRHCSTRRSGEAGIQPRIIHVPFTIHVETGGGSQERLSHIMFRSPALSCIMKDEDCPDDVYKCLNNPKAMQMCSALRRAYVEPEYITAEALLSATKRKDSWSDALNLR